MFKKSFSLMILAVALLSFNCSFKAMEDPQKNKQSEDRSLGSSENFYSVSKNALQYMCSLARYGEEDLNNLELFREKLSKICNESELENCCIILAKIKDHFASLEQFKEHAFLEITEKNLESYRKQLFLFLPAQCIDLNLLFSATANYFKEITTNSIMFEKFYDAEGFCGITLYDIKNLVLKIFIKRSNRKEGNALKKIIESSVPGRIIECIIRANLVDLYLLLAEGNIWPSLDIILDGVNGNLLMNLIVSCKDAELFKLIINREKAKSYDWDNLFSMRSDASLTALHYAVQILSKEMLEILLELMEEKGLDLDHFVYMKDQDNDSISSFELAYYSDRDTRDDAINLFVNYTTGLRKIINKHSVYSLKFLTASRYLKALKNGELDLSTSSELPKELQFYYATLDSINKHCDLVEQLKNSCTFLEITPENLNDYRKLLHVILDKENIDVNLILSIFDRYFKIIVDNPEQFIQAHTIDGKVSAMTLKNINILLTILIKRIVKQGNALEIFAFSRLEKAELWGIIDYALRDDFGDSLLFLARENLLPRLNCICDDRSNSFLAHLFIKCKNMNVFNVIIDKEKNKEYNWKELLGIGNQLATVLHYAVFYKSKEKVEAILNLIMDKELDLADFINIQTSDGVTPLMVANGYGYSEIAELLIRHGAQ